MASTTSGLTNWWSFADYSYTDSVGGVTMTVGRAIYNNEFPCYDHNDKEDSCIELDNGYLVIPSGVYFNSEFTLTAWVEPGGTSDTYTRILEFGNGVKSDNIILMLNGDSTSAYYPRFYTFYSSSQIAVVSNTRVYANAFYFLAATFESTQAKLYINGVLVGSISYTSFLPKNVIRTRNYLGGSSWGGSQTNSVIDDIRIYNRALSATEIVELYGV